ncbi:hypothetical protein J3Q64DRAFT_1752632 [Phycomyces blakesleeanus]|uniref:Uncharacterized protein n=1 Tax=Phycomyces blakesleeanus TaxID=4837 RepID=A0ABR3AXW2_PHYBL
MKRQRPFRLDNFFLSIQLHLGLNQYPFLSLPPLYFTLTLLPFPNLFVSHFHPVILLYFLFRLFFLKRKIAMYSLFLLFSFFSYLRSSVFFITIIIIFS